MSADELYNYMYSECGNDKKPKRVWYKYLF